MIARFANLARDDKQVPQVSVRSQLDRLISLVVILVIRPAVGRSRTVVEWWTEKPTDHPFHDVARPLVQLGGGGLAVFGPLTVRGGLVVAWPPRNRLG